MKIDRLKVAGFKSFADPVEISIGPGITGIVGPNGCGKSNLIEALRWAMGETSAKRMRADGMDDVIFGGTDIRPPRSSCEVTVSIDNSARLAPSEFNGDARLEVSRRLDRGEGSSYRVNSKAARARDVQVLYKDAGIGAGSSALVSQGKVGAIINAKPSERRTVLEEAAGVTGLASRRHEAELRLRGTEQNLERAEDMERGLSEQLSSLRRQARQAKRRNEIDGLVRAAEAAAFLVRWRVASSRTAETDTAFRANEEAVMERMIAFKAADSGLARAEATAAPAVQARMEAETAFALAKARIENVRKEAASAKSALAAAQKAVERTRADIERESAALGSSGDEFEDLRDRKAIAVDDREYDSVLIEEAAAAALSAKEAFEAVTARVQAMAEALAASRAERSAAERRRSDALSRLASSEAKLAAVRARLAESRAGLAALPLATDDEARAESALADADAAVPVAESTLRAAADREAEARRANGDVKAELSAVVSEARALASSRTEGAVAGAGMRVDGGMEPAVAAAFGDGLQAGLSENGNRWWAKSAARSSIPDGTEPLERFVEVPEAMKAAVSGIGLAASEAEADAAAKRLQPGQAVVTRDGRLWRWDGYRSAGDAVAAEEMRRAGRLRHLESERGRLERETAETESCLAEAVAAAAEARAKFNSARMAAAAAREALASLRAALEGTERERSELESRISAGAEAEQALAADFVSDAEAAAECEAALTAMPSILAAEARLEDGRAEAAKSAAVYEKARAALEKVLRDAEARLLLIQNIDQQMQDFDRRIVAVRSLIDELKGRLAEAEQEAARLSGSEALAPDAEQAAMEALEDAAIVHGEALTLARDSEAGVAAARSALKEVELALASRREDRARLLAELKAAQEAAAELAREIGERLSCGAGELGMLAGIADGAELPDLHSCEARVQRLSRERDSIGTVNLLAEEQLAEVEAKLGETGKAREELREAVRRLRATIAEFDREARERLNEAFALIDGHFRDLFSRLFGGGHAYLRLSGSEDILDAGLEIYACPPGKKLQAMSLLSGGEQALAALALIFAAFLIRPAPVCVLDEVDAPLDDANVDRLCSMVADMAKDSTRFLVVTHHALTMARCDRLYGVTMAERGVSRLAVLDMDAAVALIEE